MQQLIVTANNVRKRSNLV